MRGFQGCKVAGLSRSCTYLIEAHSSLQPQKKQMEEGAFSLHGRAGVVQGSSEAKSSHADMWTLTDT